MPFKTSGLSAESLEKLRRHTATPDLMAELATKGEYKRPAHWKLLGKALAEAVEKGGGRIIVTMPPRHGKSHLCSWWFPVWYLCRNPKKRVIMAGYEADFAESWGRKVRDTMEDLKWLTEDIEVRKDSAAANRWELKGHGGGMITAGVGGRLSGLGCDILIIDDPIKNAAEANSETARENLWDWWTSVAHTRLEPGGTAVVIHTRWHQDDMIGRLLREDAHDHRWKVFNFPAIAEENDVLGRKPGDPLWPDRYGVKDLEQIKKSVGTYAWSALYQQRPVPPGGDVFKHEWFSKDRRYSVESMEAEHGGAYRLGDLVVGRDQMRVFQTVDLATSTKSWADYTVIATWGVYWHGTRPLLFLLHVHRKRMEGPTIVMKLQDLIREWGADYARVEKVAFQLAFVQDARRLGLPIREFVPDKDKLSRALAATPYCESGQVVFPQWASWLSDCETELYAFPRATHDDFVDALTMAVEELRGRGCGIAGEIDLSYSRDRRQEIQNCVAEPAAEVVPLESEPMDWQNFSYFSGDGGGGGSSGEKVRDPYRR